MNARYVVLALLAGALILFFALGGQDLLTLDALKASRDSLSATVEARPWTSALIFGLVYAAAIAVSVPGAAILTLAAGAIFGLVRGAMIASLASTLGATVAMLAARFIARDWVKRRFPDAARRIDRGIEKDGNAFLLSLRLAPIFPFFLINLAMGLTRMPPLRYAALTLIGAFPGTIAYTYAGTALAGLESPGDVLSGPMLLAFLLLALLPLAGKVAAKRITGRKARGGFTTPERFDFNLIVIGAGSAGLVASLVASQLKAKVLLVEREEMGGDCLNTGCVPSKSLLRAARAAAEARNAGRFGISAGPVTVDFRATMRWVTSAIAAIAPNDSVERYSAMGVDVRRASARLVDPWTVELDDGSRLTGRSILIATGAAPIVPDLPGLAQSGFATSETLWAKLEPLDEVPGRTIVVGGGPIGCELGQAFCRLGSVVAIVEGSDRLLDKEDAVAAAIVRAALEDDGVTIRTASKAVGVDKGALLLDDESALGFDLLLLAVGRKPRLDGLGLDRIGIDPSSPLHKQRREPWDHIRFAGDAAGGPQFTHFAGHGGAVGAINAVAGPFGRFDTDKLVPRVTYTDPEVAAVGMTEAQASEAGREVEIVDLPLHELDRAVVDGAGKGLVKVVLKAGSDRILGVTIVAPHAGEMLMPWVLAIKKGLGLKAMMAAIHPYPTYSEAGRAAAGQWRKAHRPEKVLDWLGRWLAWRRG